LRRRFLNTALAALRPLYLDDLQRYRRALRQRNELLRRLRDGGRDAGDLAPWTEQLAISGAAVATARERFIADLATRAAELHGLVGGGEKLGLAYRGDLAEAGGQEAAGTRLRERLAHLADLEVRRGTTLAGPHRDDLEIEINGVPARQYASQGQQRTAALALKLGQAQVAQEWTGEPPLLLLDDCLSELDPTRARAVLDLADTLDGLLVTSAKLDPVLAERAGAAVYEVRDGQVQRVK
jgi:DNA replication and repair protein RecF